MATDCPARIQAGGPVTDDPAERVHNRDESTPGRADAGRIRVELRVGSDAELSRVFDQECPVRRNHYRHPDVIDAQQQSYTRHIEDHIP